MKVNTQERVEQARKNFASGYNCAQAVVLTYSDIMDIDPKILATISASFGGGMGRLREVCGAVSGMSMVAGALAPACDPTIREAKNINYNLVKALADDFRSENGSIVCRELLGLAPTPSGTPLPKKRPCAELVEMAAEIVARHINEQK
ncbi:MAG: C-GCAxxG-C-C family protein [Rikenellaceae bacterium]